MAGVVNPAAINAYAQAAKMGGVGGAEGVAAAPGASFGDLLSQPVANGGLGLGTVVTSAIFLLTILGLVAYLTATERRVAGRA